MKDSTQLLDHLAEVISRINKFSNIPTLLTYLQKELQSTLGTNTVWLFIVDENNPNKLKLMTASGSVAEYGYNNISEVDISDDTLIPLVLTAENPIFIRDMENDVRTNKKLVKESGARSTIVSRVMVEHRKVGIFGTGTHFDEGNIDLTKAQISFFQGLTHAIGIVFDKLAHQNDAKRDPLTHILNRNGLSDIAGMMLCNSKRNFKQAAVMYIDLDNFKPINDTFGHRVGDQLLISFAEALEHSVRKSDVVARVGGDEFVVFLSEIKSASDLNSVLHAINKNTKKISVNGHEGRLTYSVGNALFPKDGTLLDDLINIADSKMYEKKSKLKHLYL